MRSTWGALLSLAAIIGMRGGQAEAQEFTSISDGVFADSTVAYPADGTVVYPHEIDSGFVSPPISNPLTDSASSSYGFLRKDFMDGVGYEDGATTVGAFIPLAMTSNSGFFFQPQVFITDVGDAGVNFGGGFRAYMPEADRVIGAYGFYDNDESFHDHRRNQIAVGVETLGPMWDFRINGYIPLDDDEDFLGPGPGGLGRFEQAIGGADIEFGIPIFDPSAFGRLRAYFGLYAYGSDDKLDDDPAGARVRLEGHLNQHATFNASFMHDDKFGDMVTMYVEFRGWSSRLPGMDNTNTSNRAKLYLPAVRQYRIANEVFFQ